MRIEGFTTNVTQSNSALYLNGFDTIVGQAFKSPRVKSDESGFELTRKAQLSTPDDTDYVLGTSDTDVDGVTVLPNGETVEVPPTTYDGIQFAVVSFAGSLLITEGDGVTLLVPDGYLAATRDANSFVQIKNISSNTYLLLGDLAPE